MHPIGSSPPRPDGLAKVTGEAIYADDFAPADLHFGATVRSPHPHARLGRIGWRSSTAPSGALLLTARDLIGINGVKLIDDRWPILADRIVRHVGEPVALVAAPSRRDARLAREAVEVEYEPLPAILSLDEAAVAEPLYELTLDPGNIESALDAADLIVEGEYRTGHQEHIYIECQGMTAWFDADGRLEVVGSMQCPYYVHKSLVHALGLADDRVRVRASAVGGGFGGKEDFPSVIALHAALLAGACRRPVRIAYDRHEDIIGTTKRHPSVIRHRTGVERDGKILAMDIEITLDGGAYLTLSSVVLSRALLHATGPYRCPAVRIRACVLQTHTAPNGAFRGFGVPQAAFAVERQMDAIARAVGVDPYEIRHRNVLERGDRLPTGQVLDASASGRRCLEVAEQRTAFRERWRAAEAARGNADDGRPRRGVGLSLYFHGAGFTGNGERLMRSPVDARLLEDGRIEVLTAMTDMGQGSAVVFPQIAAAAAGLTFEDFVFAAPDTGLVPNSGPTVASRTTMIVGGLIARAVSQIRSRVLEWHGGRTGARDLRVLDGAILGAAGSGVAFREVAARFRELQGPLEVTVRHEPDPAESFDEALYQGSAYPTYAWGADVAEVEVDSDTLEVKPIAVTAVCEVGRAIHPTLCKGQIEGGTVQALGFALCEELKVKHGRYLNDRLATYIIPTIKDSPRLDVELLESDWEGGPFGAKGVGELPMDGGAPAVIQAVENAIGIVASAIPATPEHLFECQRRGQVVGEDG
jgi:CO/xanthine dehydrogenase Mo-binding subunit